MVPPELVPQVSQRQARAQEQESREQKAVGAQRQEGPQVDAQPPAEPQVSEQPGVQVGQQVWEWSGSRQQVSREQLVLAEAEEQQPELKRTRVPENLATRAGPYRRYRQGSNWSESSFRSHQSRARGQ